ncbi:hypothetical protein MUG91_G717n1 [Manis pentadactyla]|nr:hypothetical protein MUG91_G717n1 [Manis pentadactyla]
MVISQNRAAQIPKAPDPWSKEAVLLALERWKRKKRTVEEEEEQTSVAGQEDKRRCHDSSGSGHSAFKPEVANGVRAAFVPEPGPLKRGLSYQSSDGELRKRTCTPAVSCSKGTCACGIRMSSRNAITSSYTSTGGICHVHAPCGVAELGSLHLLVDYAVFTIHLLSDAEITSKLTAVTNP